MRILPAALAVLLVTLTACEKKPEATQVPPSGATGMMGGGPQMTMQGTQEMAMMGAQLDSLGAMAPAQMIAMMPAHQALATQMMGSMGAVMQGMNMQLDSGWVALSDSVRQDLTAMPGLSDGALQSRMQSHIGRMRRMMTMYQGMTRR
jgi:hypothetical protein